MSVPERITSDARGTAATPFEVSIKVSIMSSCCSSGISMPAAWALLGYVDKLGMDDEMGAFISWFSRARPNTTKKFFLIPGVDEMLAALQGRFPMSVVSARHEKSTMHFLEQFDLVKYFDTIITGLSAPHTKPFPDPIYLAAERMGVKAGECLMIGDTTVDIRAGRSAGAQAVGVLCGFGEEKELREMGADLILSTTPDVVKVLDPSS